eukprot:UN15525
MQFHPYQIYYPNFRYSLFHPSYHIVAPSPHQQNFYISAKFYRHCHVSLDIHSLAVAFFILFFEYSIQLAETLSTTFFSNAT